MLHIEESIKLLISRDQPRDPQLVPIEPPPKNIEDLNHTTPSITPTSTSSVNVQDVHEQMNTTGQSIPAIPTLINLFCPRVCAAANSSKYTHSK